MTKTIQAIDAQKTAQKKLTENEYTNLFCITLKNAITSNRLILASTFLSLNAGISYEDLLTFAKTSCGREWNASNRAFFSQPIRAGRNLFNKYEKNESFLKIVNTEGVTLEEKAEALVELLGTKKITVNSLLRPKAEEPKAEETLEEKIFSELQTVADKYKNNVEEFTLALLSQLEFLHGLDGLEKLTKEYTQLSQKVA